MKTRNVLAFVGMIGLGFAASAFADTYNCVFVRQKGDSQQLVKQFQLVPKENDEVYVAEKIDGNYAAVCGIDLKNEKDSDDAVLCGFVNMTQDAALPGISLAAPTKGIKVLSLALTNYGGTQILAMHAKDEFQDIAYCGKAK